ncbi:protein ECERIFERUM 26-like [Senna tora]|uniref:Protein ECERIFERUM 26-like n=1 Tax=Senna tora TaxID=362788 RepID=A0A834T9Z0_9FABA|nr:protein ECERIFERUM 26-like [Senna tora]
MPSSSRPRVSLHSVLTAVSSKPVGSGITHPLSALDHAMALHTVHLIFYYHHNLFGSFDLDPSRESLSRVLSLYPMITGRFTRDTHGNWEIKCNDAGVRVIKATVDTTLHQWLQSADGSQEMHLTAWDDMPHDFQTWSPFRIQWEWEDLQINEFEGGGVAIGVSCSHMVGDLTWAFSFFNSWTRFHRHLPLPPLSHPTPTSNSNSNSKQPPYFAAATSSASPNKMPIMGTATFKFSTSSISDTLRQLHPNATPFDFLSALFWTRLCRYSSSNNITHSLSICIDSRKLFNSPLPTSPANAFHFSLLSVDVRDMESSQVGDIAALVHNHLEAIKEDQILSTLDWLESQRQLGGGKYREPSQMYGPYLTCVCLDGNGRERELESSLIYGAMFEEGEKAVHVSCHVGNVEGEGLLIVMPSPEGGLARTVTLTLPQNQLALLCQDEAILNLQPTMLLTPTLHVSQ